MKIAVVGVPGGWSSERLADAVQSRTGFRLLADLGRASADLAAGRLMVEEEDLCAMDAIMLKKVGPAYSPDLLNRLELLRLAEDRGVRIFSRASRVSRVINRLSCTVTLAAAGIPIPPTVVTEDPAEAAKAVERLGPCVLKPLYTSKARGMALVQPDSHLLDNLLNFKASGNKTIYVQKMVDLGGRDLGVVFLGGRYLATYARVGNKDSWNTTTGSGGRYQAYHPSDKIIALAQKAQDLFGLDFTCVDVAETPDGPVVFEVSAFGGFRGLLESAGMDAAQLYLDHVLEEIMP